MDLTSRAPTQRNSKMLFVTNKTNRQESCFHNCMQEISTLEVCTPASKLPLVHAETVNSCANDQSDTFIIIWDYN